MDPIYILDPYVDDAGEHRWRLIHVNGNIVADSAEGYVNPAERDEQILHIEEAFKTNRVEFRRSSN